MLIASRKRGDHQNFAPHCFPRHSSSETVADAIHNLVTGRQIETARARFAIAPTGAGKTTLFKNLLPYRQYNIFFGTMPDDKLYKSLIKQPKSEENKP